MTKRIGVVISIAIFLIILLSPMSFAAIRDYGEGNNNFHKDHFSISENIRGHGSIAYTDSNGFYNGSVQPDLKGNDFVVWYKMDFSGEDQERINKGDISVNRKHE